MCMAEGIMNGDWFVHFLRVYLLPDFLPFNGVNPQSVVIINDASIHHVEKVRDLIEVQSSCCVKFNVMWSSCTE